MLVTQARFVAPDISGVSKSRVKSRCQIRVYIASAIEIKGYISTSM